MYSWKGQCLSETECVDKCLVDLPLQLAEGDLPPVGGVESVHAGEGATNIENLFWMQHFMILRCPTQHCLINLEHIAVACNAGFPLPVAVKL